MNTEEKASPLGSRTIIIRRKYPADLYITEVMQCEDGKSFFTAVIQCIEKCLSKNYADTFQRPRRMHGKILMHFQENIGVRTEFPVTVDLSIDTNSEYITLDYRLPVPHLTSRQLEVDQTLLRLNRTLRFPNFWIPDSSFEEFSRENSETTPSFPPLPKFIVPKEKSDCILATYSLPTMDCFSEETFREMLKTIRWSLFWELHTFLELAQEEQGDSHDERDL